MAGGNEHWSLSKLSSIPAMRSWARNNSTTTRILSRIFETVSGAATGFIAEAGGEVGADAVGSGTRWRGIVELWFQKNLQSWSVKERSCM